ncbi:MAG TPA: DUF4097 family beta strand repeat-containing protein [Terriglobales bacterium]|nr:DUF4097 family beta strand repeat-containing protein [Terriglobales bacterium]
MSAPFRHSNRWVAVTAACILALPLYLHAEKKEFKYSVAPGATVTIINQKGTITVKTAAGRQLLISANPASDKVEVDASQTGNRISLRTHSLKATADEARVDYEIQAPADVNVTIDSGSGDVEVENLHGNVSLDAEEGQVKVTGVSGGFVQVQSVNANISLTNVQKSRVQLASTGGSIQLNNVSGPNVTAKTTAGTISFAGDFAGGGNYLFTSHSGDIGVSLPASASIDLTARSIQGSVENDFPLQKPAHSAFAVKEGKTLAGTSNSASSSVELRSFSGKIRLKKQ